MKILKSTLMSITIIAAAVLFASNNAAIILTNSHSAMKFDGRGQIISVAERESGRELLLGPSPFVGIENATDGRLAFPDRLEMRNGRMVFSFPSGSGSVELSVKEFDGGTTYEVAAFSGTDAMALHVGRMVPSPVKWVGRRANMASDGQSALCVRAYDLFSEMYSSSKLLYVRIPAGKAKGAKIGIVGAPRRDIKSALKAMTIASGRPYSPAGGAWASDNEAVRGSYLNAYVTASSLDDWIDLAERGGFDVVHFRENWYARLGEYPLNPSSWPGGIEQMKAAVAKIHAAGYRAGLHTLTGCISPKVPWVAGSENSDLITRESYTLSEDISADATEMTVNEAPQVQHDVVFTYSGNGNAIRIGNEIVQYSGYTKTPPYRYTGLTRGAFGTKASAHRKGERAGYLLQRYLAFYPMPDSALADRLADTIASVYNGCGFDMIYCDGCEGMGSAYGSTVMRDKIIARCSSGGRPCINEDSMGSPTHAWAHTWWYHSRVGAWDSCYWAPKRFFDLHVKRTLRDNIRNADLLEIQMGWWAPILSSLHYPAQKLDDMEYFASRNAGLDASMSISSVDVTWRELKFNTSRLMTVLGWYERARRARLFRKEVLESFNRQGAEFRLRQDIADGEWKVSPVQVSTLRFLTPETEKQSLQCAAVAKKTALRVEALYTGAHRSSTNRTVLTSGVKASDLICKSANADIAIVAAPSHTDGGERAIRLTASNRSGTSRGAWASASALFEPHRVIGDNTVMRFRVKGDGSGALLNIQPETPREYGHSLAEHYVTLDFTGWRDFEMPLRERDAARYCDYEWPYKGYAVVFHRLINGKHVSAVNFYLNEIPAGGKAEAEVSDIVFVPLRQLQGVRSEVVINGKSLAVPFEMQSGDFAELEDGVWTLYSPDGDPMRRVFSPDSVALLQSGVNEVVCRARGKDGTRSRMEVIIFAVGAEKNAFQDFSSLTPEAKKLMSYEAAEPQFYAPGKGFAELSPIMVRSGERAKMEVTLYGPMSGCTLNVAGVDTELPAVEKGKHRRFTLTGEYSGVCPVKIAPKNLGECEARFEFVKRYR